MFFNGPWLVQSRSWSIHVSVRRNEASKREKKKNRKRFCEEWIAETMARADGNTHVTPSLYISRLSG